ncbi:hypothetical protein ACFYOG_32185 [Streptomyces sp. NPDC007818]|uniref:hypothetical protein n=1 Tax=Streptomyces sp. NPDC007818 TaxID=3364780 RepID=UPI003683E458
MDRTDAESGWYTLCHRVLTWFLCSAGMEADEAEDAVHAAIGGRFKSWSRPSRTLVDAAGEDFAVDLTGVRSYPDR